MKNSSFSFIEIIRFFVICSMFFTSLPMVSEDIWLQSPWSSNPAQLLAEASAIPVAEGVDVMILLDENTYVFDGEGRQKHTRRMVWRIVTKQGAENWATTSER